MPARPAPAAPRDAALDMPTCAHNFPARRPLTSSCRRDASLAASAPAACGGGDALLPMNGSAAAAAEATAAAAAGSEDAGGAEMIAAAPTATEPPLSLTTTGRALSSTAVRKAECGLQTSATDAGYGIVNMSVYSQQPQPLMGRSHSAAMIRMAHTGGALPRAPPAPPFARRAGAPPAPAYRQAPSIQGGGRHRQWQPSGTVPPNFLGGGVPRSYSYASELQALRNADEARRLGASVLKPGWVRRNLHMAEKGLHAYMSSERIQNSVAYAVPVRPGAGDTSMPKPVALRPAPVPVRPFSAATPSSRPAPQRLVRPASGSIGRLAGSTGEAKSQSLSEFNVRVAAS